VHQCRWRRERSVRPDRRDSADMSDTDTRVQTIVRELEDVRSGLGIAVVDISLAAPTLVQALERFATSSLKETPIDRLITAIDTLRSARTLPTPIGRYPERPDPSPADMADVIVMSLNCSQSDQRIGERRSDFAIPTSVKAYYRLAATSSSRFRTQVEADAFKILACHVAGTAGRHDTRTVVAANAAPSTPSDTLLTLDLNNEIDIVCSEIPTAERPYYASSADRNYLRYAKFADLDALIYLKSRVARIFRHAHVTDYVASEYPEREPGLLLIVGGPPWNALFRQRAEDLPFHFLSNELGIDDPLVIDSIEETISPTYSAAGRLSSDVALLVRRNSGSGRWIWMFGGCLTLGVLGAAMAVLEPTVAESNAIWLRQRLPTERASFVVAFRVWRAGSSVALQSFTDEAPIALLAQATPSRSFELVFRS